MPHCLQQHKYHSHGNNFPNTCIVKENMKNMTVVLFETCRTSPGASKAVGRDVPAEPERCHRVVALSMCQRFPGLPWASVSSPNRALLRQIHGLGTIPKQIRDKTALFVRQEHLSMCSLLPGFSTWPLACSHTGTDVAIGMLLNVSG